MHVNYFGSGWTKLYIEKMCDFFSRLGVTKHTVIRHTNIFGPHDKFDLEKSHMFGASVTKTMTSKTDAITVWGTGEEARDLLYVDDLVRFVELAMDGQKSAYEMLHASAGHALQIKDVVNHIVRVSGRELHIEHDLAGPTIRTSFALDSRRARQLLGWEPKISFDEGVRRTVDWWRKTFEPAS